MRDMERIKPKYNVTLDNKQIVMLIISSLVILVLVFIIGFVLGKNAGSREQQIAAATQQEAMPQNAVVFTQQTMQAGQGATPAAQEGTQVTAGAVTQTTAAVSHTELTFYKSLTDHGKRPETGKHAVRKTEKKKIEKKKTMRVAAVRSGKGKFSIQCGAFRERSQADRLSSELRKKYRLDSWIEPISEKSEKMYRVKIGHFETHEQAQLYEKRTLLKKGIRNCVITVGQ